MNFTDLILLFCIALFVLSIPFFCYSYLIKKNRLFPAIKEGISWAIVAIIPVGFVVFVIAAGTVGILNKINEPNLEQNISERVGNLDSQIDMCKNSPKNIDDTFEIKGIPLIYTYYRNEPWYSAHQKTFNTYQSIVDSKEITLFLIYHKDAKFIGEYNIVSGSAGTRRVYQISYDVCTIYLPDKTVIGEYTITGDLPSDSFTVPSSYTAFQPSEDIEDTGIEKGSVLFYPDMDDWIAKLQNNT